MASSSLTVSSCNGLIRRFGGNRREVRAEYDKYSRMTLEEFLSCHPTRTKEDYDTIRLSTKFNKS